MTPPPGIELSEIEEVVGRLPAPLVELALWLAGYYGSTPGRALALVAPAMPKRRGERARPLEREALARRAGAGDADRVAGDRRSGGSCSRSTAEAALPPLRGDRQRQDRGLPAGLRRGARARQGRDRAGAGDLADAADAGPLPPALRRGDRRAALAPERGRAPRRARADRLGRGEGRDRRPLGGVRAGRGSRSDRLRRGARLVLQAGVRSPLRRSHRRRQARRARGGGRRLRQRHAEAGVLAGAGAPRAGRAPAREAAAGEGRGHAPRARLSALLAADRRAGRVSKAGAKAILLLNRRGLAPALHCRACGQTLRCPTATWRWCCTRDGRCTAITAATPSRSPSSARPAARPSCRGSAPAPRSSSASWRGCSPSWS